MNRHPAADIYSDRTVFITGATGFLGKAVLEKLLRAVPDVRKVFVLCRPGKGRNVQERVTQEILSSPIFNPLKDQLSRQAPGRGDDVFRQLMCKVFAVAGDMTSPKLGISAEEQRVLAEEVDIVIHCAASVNFDERLDNAIQLNTLGALELYAMCETWNHVQSYVHVSTAYVSANQHHGREIPERVHELDFDPMQVIRDVEKFSQGGSMTLEQIRLKIMGFFPNTYTLTKAMTEVLLERRERSVPLAIVRPSIIGAAWREPCPGWVDVVSAATGVFLAGGLGVVTMLPGNPMGVADIVPVDHVVNHILLAGAEIFRRPSSELHVSHSCTSTVNPLRWRVCARSVLDSFNENHTPSGKLTPGPVRFKMVSSPEQFALEWSLKYTLPVRVYALFSQVVQSEAHQKRADQLKMLVDKAQHLVHLFEPFTSHEFMFASGVMKQWVKQSALLRSQANAAPVDDTFTVDVTDVVWHQYFANFAYGINRFILHEDVVPVSDTAVTHNDMKLTTDRLLKWDSDHHRISFPGLIPDISWAYTSSRQPGYTKQGFFGRMMGLTGWREGLAHEAKYVPRRTVRPVNQTLNLVLHAPVVQQRIQHVASGSNKSVGEVTAQAKRILNGIASTLEDTPPRAFSWLLRKVFRKLYSGIRVHELGLERIRNAMMSNDNVPIVLMPTHRSYMDFLLMSFVFFAHNLPVPFIAADEGFAGMSGVSNLLRASGAFFLKRDGSFKDDPLYQTVFTEYMHRLLEDGQVVEYFVEGTRSRSGKCLEAKTGLVSMCIEPVLSGRVKDVLLVPIAIDYEKPLEVTLYSDEMLGTNKQPETTTNLIKAISVLKSKFGHVSMQFEEPISVKSYLVQSPLMRQPKSADWGINELSRPLGFKVIQHMNRASLCMTTHLVATLVSMNRHGIALEQLIPMVDWLRGEIRERGSDVVCVEGIHRKTLTQNALKLLYPLIEERSGHRIFEVAVHQFPKDFKNMIALGYYRNKMIHLFAEEAIWACVLCAELSHRVSANQSLANLSQLRCGRVGDDDVLTFAGADPAGSGSSQSRPWKYDGLPSIMKWTMGDNSNKDGVDELGSDAEAATSSNSNGCTTDSLLPGVLFLGSMLKREFVAMGSLEQDVAPQDAFVGVLHKMAARGIVVLREDSTDTSRGVRAAKTVAVGETHAARDAQQATAVSSSAKGTSVSLRIPESDRIFSFLCNLIWPFVDSYFVAAAALVSLQPNAQVELNVLIQRMSLLAETLYHDRVLKHYESCSIGVLQNAIHTFQEWKVLSVDTRRLPKKLSGSGATREQVVSLLPPFTTREALNGLISKIDMYRRPVASSANLASFSAADFPFLARM